MRSPPPKEDPPGFLPQGGNYRELSFHRTFMDTRPPEVLANLAICLIHQANYLLDQQRRRLEKDFVKKGGIRERMTQARLQHRMLHRISTLLSIVLGLGVLA